MITKEEQQKNPAKSVAATGASTPKPRKEPTTQYKPADQSLIDTSNKIGAVASKAKDFVTGIAKDTYSFWEKNPSPMFQDIKYGIEGVGTTITDKLDKTHDYVFGAEKKKADPNSPFSKAVNQAPTVGLNDPFSPVKAAAPDISFQPKDHTRVLGTINGKTVTANPVTGALLKDGQAVKEAGFVRSPVVQQMVSNLQTPKPQTGIPGVTQAPDAIPGAMPGGNWTGLMNAETAMLNSVVNPKLKPGQFQDFKGTIGMNPNAPGGDTGFREIESQIAALTRQNNQLLGGYGQTTEMARIPLGRRNAMVEENTKQIAALSQSLTGRSALANDLVKALIGAQSGAQVAGIGAQADVTKAGITGDATVKAAQYDAMGDTATANAKLNQDADYKNNKIKLDSYKAIQQDLRKQLDANPGDVAIQTKLDKINAAIEMFSSNGDDFLEQFIQKS